MLHFKKVFSFKVLISAYLVFLMLCSGYSHAYSDFSLRVPMSQDTYQRIAESIEKQLERYFTEHERPTFTVWVVCNQNRERSPIVASIISSKIPEGLRKYITIESYGIRVVESDEYVDAAVVHDSLLRNHIPLQIPYDDIDKPDLVLVMTESQRRTLVAMGFPDSRVKMVVEEKDLFIKGIDYDAFREKISGDIGIIMQPILSAYIEKIRQESNNSRLAK
ncbi:MAG: hypothetical protein ABH815_02730 [Candidatus Omnitrophota bacterium]